MTYTVVLTEDEDEPVFNATVPALPGCHTWGATEEEAYRNAQEAIQAYLEALAKEKAPVPREVGKREVEVAIP
ncbi:MAG: type II toxin-antitoxin system HicB family antitoxin [Planctomycetota bacterium]|nr:type II toxin-antitoxin system HicB family antitoxin [Planctomycetota bacterium]